ncbi:MAG: 1,4-alpha-glucan-branching enzyme [Bacteroidales bacterium]|nr:1,4-alpha-glucan-branching enzyme [Bacteroidales bacterium]
MTNGKHIWESDPYLKPYKPILQRRQSLREIREQEITGAHENLVKAVNNHLYYGVHKTKEGWVCREWAPNATDLYLIGECNGWQKDPDYAFLPIGSGNWELHLPKKGLGHGQLYKWFIEWPGGAGERLPAYARRCVQDPVTKIFSAQVWEPPHPYPWKHKAPLRVQNPLIYEAHIGMSSEESGVSGFNQFAKEVLPRIERLGYNTLQLMAIQEHPYYGSFGYQVSNFFAVSSRFGTPEELKHLIDQAHARGIAVVLDIVHSHAVKNEIEGLSRFDGTYDLYFHKGSRGEHPLWSSRLFDYGKEAVLHFLLSNLKYWTEEFKFDGFRFDGVTSMIYYDHGLERDFTGYSCYFDGLQDEDALTYLGLANQLIHECNPNAITIAEEVSGMPSLAYPAEYGGVGFDFRMSMGVADRWIQWIKELKDQEWHVGDMFYELTNKRSDERTISYAECHDQAMVGDKTIIFRLIDKEMYTGMSKHTESMVVDRGIALHKIIRLLTLSSAGDGYLNFMGNEFGHPEWIDFPREGNEWSYHYARRQWSLVDDKALRYKGLELFDRAMIHMAKKHSLYDHLPKPVVQDTESQVLAFMRGNLLFVFNLSPENSYTDYGMEVKPGKYTCILNTDDLLYGGFSRYRKGTEHFTVPQPGTNTLFLYLPARSGMVFIAK